MSTDDKQTPAKPEADDFEHVQSAQPAQPVKPRREKRGFDWFEFVRTLCFGAACGVFILKYMSPESTHINNEFCAQFPGHARCTSAIHVDIDKKKYGLFINALEPSQATAVSANAPIAAPHFRVFWYEEARTTPPDSALERVRQLQFGPRGLTSKSLYEQFGFKFKQPMAATLGLTGEIEVDVMTMISTLAAAVKELATLTAPPKPIGHLSYQTSQANAFSPPSTDHKPTEYADLAELVKRLWLHNINQAELVRRVMESEQKKPEQATNDYSKIAMPRVALGTNTPTGKLYVVNTLGNAPEKEL